MKRLVISVIVAVVLLMIPVSVALAAEDTAQVTVTAVPSYVSISINPGSWTINGISGSGVLEIDTIYYSKDSGSETTAFGDPVVAGNCEHAITNDSTVNITLKADMSNFTGGDAMTNGGGSNGASAFAAWVCESGANWSSDQVVMNTSGSSVFWTSSSAGDDISVAFAVETQTGAWSSGDSMSSTITLTATSA
jgi:hypothetical protein